MSLLNGNYSAPNSIRGDEVDFSQNKIGIVHFGMGAFHRAHQAFYTHEAMAKHGGDWSILGVNLRSAASIDDLNAQDGLYTLAIRDDEKLNLQLIKSIKKGIAASQDLDSVFETLKEPTTRIVSMTVTEKAYGILRDTGHVDLSHESNAHDLKNPNSPIGIMGIIVKGLKERFEKGIKPFTVLCCDNLPQNGDLVRAGVLDFAKRTGKADFVSWIENECYFPNSMVDRITPATTPELLQEVESKLGARDALTVETEPFTQWVIEDSFTDGRPKWESSDVIFVSNVEPYEHMKLRMLNGAHSMIAYAGVLLGHTYVRDVMADNVLKNKVYAHMQAAAKTLIPLNNIDFEEYAAQLMDRFSNKNIAHETYQIAMDGSQKMPQRIFEPAIDCLANIQSASQEKQMEVIAPFALATALWIIYCEGKDMNANAYALRDPREEELQAAFNNAKNDAKALSAAFLALPNLFPQALQESEIWKSALQEQLGNMLENGVSAAFK